jgi:hypothetical protein
MPDKSKYDMTNYSSYDRLKYPSGGNDDYVQDRKKAIELKYWLIVPGLIFFGVAEIFNVYHSFSNNSKYSSAPLGDFHLSTLPTRNGNGVAYGLIYNRSF